MRKFSKLSVCRLNKLVRAAVLLTLICAFVLSIRPVTAATFTVYLTFDDGPWEGRTNVILDILKKYNVKATFFIEGKHVDGAGELIQRELNEGHHIGNHLWFHEVQIMIGANPSDKLLLQRYEITDEAMRAALGEKLWAQYNAQEPVKPFRWPGGAAKTFPRNDVITYNWQVSSGDAYAAKTPTVAQEINNVLYGYPPDNQYGVYAWMYSGTSSVIVLMHDTSPRTQEALPKIIESLQANGATFGVLPRPGDQGGEMPFKLGVVPPCANQEDNCGKENSMGLIKARQ